MNQATHTATTTQGTVTQLVDKASDAVEQTLKAGQTAGLDALEQASSTLSRAVHRAEQLALQGKQELSRQAHQASDRTVTYIRDEPVKAVLLAAALGAGIAALLSMSARRH